MHQVEKKKKRALPHGRRWLAVGTAALAVLCWALFAWTGQSDKPVVEKKVFTTGKIHSYPMEDVAAVSVTLRSGESWSITRGADGRFAIDGENAWVDEASQAALENALCTIGYEDTFTDDPAVYAPHMEDFGLDVPKAVVSVTYADGVQCTLRIGNRCAEEGSGLYYMLVDGDPRLLALDRGTAETLIVQKNSLYAVTQPVLHKDRFDSITFTGGDGQVQAQWTLQGGIGGNAQDRWQLTFPLCYPADGEKMANLLANLQNIRLGAYAAPATEENLAAYGFDQPRMTIQVHQAAGAIGTTDASGVYSVTDWPEDTFTLVIGGAKNDAVDYVLVEEAIYISSHYSLNVFMAMEPRSTLSRYTVGVALGNLRRLTVEADGHRDVYTLVRTEQLAPNNDLLTDAEGRTAYDVTCQLNGGEIPYEKFEAAYQRLMLVTVTGSLPQGWTAREAPHTTFTFEDVDGMVTTVALAPYDALHDAVIINGDAVFYLIQGGMVFGITE